MKRFALNRRALLRGAVAGGVVGLALPPLEAMFNANGDAHADGTPVPRRLITWVFGNGCRLDKWVPGDQGPNFTLSEELAPLAKRHDFTMKDAVTLASIVEKETGVSEERPLIASVFLNRLARRMRLEADPAVIYGIPDFDGNLRRRDLENEDNPYNTYRIFGLPPGPIASPGEASLRAVVSPAQTDYLYFVSKNDGTHVFSASYREHINAVNRYQK